VLNPTNSFVCWLSMAIRLLVNSAMTLGNSRGDLIAANLWLDSINVHMGLPHFQQLRLISVHLCGVCKYISLS
jgi:hypothetical protein